MLTAGDNGIFDVLVDDELVASRKQGVLVSAPGRFPEPSAVVEALRARSR